MNDYLEYIQGGTFLRYLSAQHRFIITFSETPFYVFNQQQPIAQTGLILFHNLLFTTTVIAIFGLAFLLIKLTFTPIFKWLNKRKILIGLLELTKLKKEEIIKNDNRF